MKVSFLSLGNVCGKSNKHKYPANIKTHCFVNDLICLRGGDFS